MRKSHGSTKIHILQNYSFKLSSKSWTRPCKNKQKILLIFAQKGVLFFPLCDAITIGLFSLSVCLSVCLSVWVCSVCLSGSVLSISLSASVCLGLFYLSVCLGLFCLSARLFVCLSVNIGKINGLTHLLAAGF